MSNSILDFGVDCCVSVYAYPAKSSLKDVATDWTVSSLQFRVKVKCRSDGHVGFLLSYVTRALADVFLICTPTDRTTFFFWIPRDLQLPWCARRPHTASSNWSDLLTSVLFLPARHIRPQLRRPILLVFTVQSDFLT